MIACRTHPTPPDRVLLLGLTLLSAACADGPGPRDRESLAERSAASAAERPADAPRERRIIPAEWRQTVLISGAEDDSTLISPFRLVASPAGVHVLDYYPKRVLHYGHDGRRTWSFGREGAGPDEFLDPRDLTVDTDGRTWVLDPANSRIVVLGRGGSVLHRLSLGDLGNSPRELLSAGAAGALVITGERREDPMVRLDSKGRVLGRERFPWDGFSQLEYLATQVIATSSPWTGDWVMAFSMGDGFFIYPAGATQARRGWFVEPVAFPEVEVTKSGGATTWRHRERPVDAANSVTLSSENVYVLFGGTTEDRGKLVDSYALRDGSYQGTWRLPRGVSEIAWYDGGLYTLADRPYPELAYWKPARAGLP